MKKSTMKESTMKDATAPTAKKVGSNILWNTIGALFYLGCQWLLSVAVVRVSGYQDAGILALAMSITAVFATIALFSVRSFQVSDRTKQYADGEYVAHRILTCALACLLCIAFTLPQGYTSVEVWSIFAFLLVKIVEAAVDVLHGIAQTKWRLDIAGKSYLLRGALLIVTFFAVQWKWQHLALSIFAMACSNLAVLLLYDLPAVRRLNPFRLSFSKERLWRLSITCFPLLWYGIGVNAIVPCARYFIERYHGETVLGYFATVSAVAVLVQAVASFLFQPLLGLFSTYRAEGNRSAFYRLIGKTACLLAVVTAASLGACALFGEFAMVLVFGEEIKGYVYLLYPTVCAAVLTALIWLLGSVLIVLRAHRLLLCGALCGMVANVLLCTALVKRAAYFGANTAILSSLGMIVWIYAATLLHYHRHWNDTQEEHAE